MKLSVISPHSVIEHTIVWIEINTPVGNIVIQENHAPMIVEIEPNSELLFMQQNGKQVLLRRRKSRLLRRNEEVLLPV